MGNSIFKTDDDVFVYDVEEFRKYVPKESYFPDKETESYILKYLICYNKSLSYCYAGFVYDYGEKKSHDFFVRFLNHLKKRYSKKRKEELISVDV